MAVAVELSKEAADLASRIQRGLLGVASGQIIIRPWPEELPKGVILWDVTSTQTSKEPRQYVVGVDIRETPYRWACTCQDYQKRHRACKHILAVQIMYQRRVEV